MVRGYYEGPSMATLSDPTITNPTSQVLADGPRATGSVFDEDLVVTQILDGLSAPRPRSSSSRAIRSPTGASMPRSMHHASGPNPYRDMSGQLVF